MKGYVKRCAVCGREFTARYRNSVTCSDECNFQRYAAQSRRSGLKQYEKRHPDVKPYKGRKPGVFEREQEAAA